VTNEPPGSVPYRDPDGGLVPGVKPSAPEDERTHIYDAFRAPDFYVNDDPRIIAAPHDPPAPPGPVTLELDHTGERFGDEDIDFPDPAPFDGVITAIEYDFGGFVGIGTVEWFINYGATAGYAVAASADYPHAGGPYTVMSGSREGGRPDGLSVQVGDG
jgi:hypothetical protein